MDYKNISILFFPPRVLMIIFFYEIQFPEGLAKKRLECDWIWFDWMVGSFKCSSNQWKESYWSFLWKHWHWTLSFPHWTCSHFAILVHFYVFFNSLISTLPCVICQNILKWNHHITGYGWCAGTWGCSSAWLLDKLDSRDGLRTISLSRDIIFFWKFHV